MAESATVHIVRKLPIEVQAVSIANPGQLETIADWCGGQVVYRGEGDHCQPAEITISTTEGPMTVGPGWWIIKGVENEFYPCKASVFDKTYEVLS